MGLRKGILRAVVVAGTLALSNFTLAKPPDLPLDPRIACPEGRESTPIPFSPLPEEEEPQLPGNPSSDNFSLPFDPPVSEDEPEPLDVDGQDASYEEMLRATQPLDTVPLRRWWLEA